MRSARAGRKAVNGLGRNRRTVFVWVRATQAFPHPLANVRPTRTKRSVANFASYAIVEMMLYEGLGDLLNKFRKRELGLDPLDAFRGPGIVQKLRIPFTYLWWAMPPLLALGILTIPGHQLYSPNQSTG